MRIQKRGVRCLEKSPSIEGREQITRGLWARGDISKDLVMGVPGAGHLEALQCH